MNALRDHFLDLLDEEHRAALEAVPPLAIARETLPDRREALRAFADQQNELLGMPEGVVTSDHRVEAEDGHGVLVRIYRGPNTPESAAPGYFYIHGGGMVVGSVSMNDRSCARLAVDLGLVVASVEYRLAPEHPYPTPLEDCYCGLRWLWEQSEELGVDRRRLAIGGASAGGGLAAGLALLARDRAEISIVFQLLTYPMIDDRNSSPSARSVVHERSPWNHSKNAIGWDCYLDSLAGSDDVPIYAAPARASVEQLQGLPPAYIPVGTLDPFLDEDVAYARRLVDAGVAVDLRVYAGAFHGSNGFVPDAELSRRWQREEAEALARGLGL